MFGWCYGFTIDKDAPKEEVLALLEGEVLGDPNFDEYGTFITMEKEE